ncbi:unnamed protein product [Haemonchus placei]|uniref:Uncharacterized protein n=1 Tax=Haemonchus placei TaxID=6290 RepID=A0A0N4W6J9_HAEPC|nr:unnamed protein product [Haemonchus placei]
MWRKKERLTNGYPGVLHAAGQDMRSPSSQHFIRGPGGDRRLGTPRSRRKTAGVNSGSSGGVENEGASPPMPVFGVSVSFLEASESAMEVMSHPDGC